MFRMRYLLWRANAGDRFWMRLAWLLPKRLAYWATIRLHGHATTGRWSHQVVPDLTFTEALTRWESRNDPDDRDTE